VLPVTHNQSAHPAHAVEIPQLTKMRLGLDEERSWIMLNESNAFRWPGPDLRFADNGDASSVIFGMLPPGFFKIVLERFQQLETQTRAGRVMRTE
jgi:hypothetical protein